MQAGGKENFWIVQGRLSPSRTETQRNDGAYRKEETSRKLQSPTWQPTNTTLVSGEWLPECNGMQWIHCICSVRFLSSSQAWVGPWPLLCSSIQKLLSFHQHFHSRKHLSHAVSNDKYFPMSSASRHPWPNFKCAFFPSNSTTVLTYYLRLTHHSREYSAKHEELDLY